jgi:hypothetical protein
VVARRKNCCLCRESNPISPARSLITILTELPRLSVYGVTINDVSDYIHLLVRIDHIICNPAVYKKCNVVCRIMLA